jgi:hypothetical protein
MTVLANSVLVTPVRTKSGNLKLITWKLMDDGRIVRKGENDKAGAVSLIATTSFPNPAGNIVVTAVRAANGNLKLISWNISSDGRMIDRKDENDKAGAVGEIAITRGEPLGHNEFKLKVVTAVQTAKDTPKLITYSMNLDGGNIERGPDSADLVVDKGSRIAIAKTGIKPTYLTSMRGLDGRVKLIAFEEAPRNVVPTGRLEPDRVTDETALVDLGDGRVVLTGNGRDFLKLATLKITEGPF